MQKETQQQLEKELAQEKLHCLEVCALNSMERLTSFADGLKICKFFSHVSPTCCLCRSLKRQRKPPKH